MSIRWAVVAASTFALLSAGTAIAGTVVVMSGLDNPRGLAFAPNGSLYVVEAGVGGPPNIPHPNNCAFNGAGEKRCYGPTGAITRLWKGSQERVVEGLPSHASYDATTPPAPDGSSAAGPNDIAFLGNGNAVVTLALGGDEAFQDGLGAGGPFFGTLIQVAASGRWRVVADVFAHEVEQNPAGGPIDANPFGLLAEARVRYIADAGANALLAVYANGTIETVATFPSRPDRGTDAVPTSVVRGPDGALYVGELTGVPFAAGAARIYRVVPGEAPTVYLDGFKTIMDLAFDEAGNLYVVENASGPVFFGGPGTLTRIAPDGTRTLIKDDLVRPTSVAIGPDGAIYVTNNAVLPHVGEVLMITP